MDTRTNNFLKILRLIFDEQTELLLEEPVDWVQLSETARNQNLLPLFFEAANRFETYAKSEDYETSETSETSAKFDTYASSAAYAKDQFDTFTMVAEQIQRSSAFIDIYEKMTEQGIYPIVLKGIVCRQLYGEFGEHRPSGDEDILIEVKDFPKVKEILEQEHYICSIPDMTERGLNQIQEVGFYNPEQRLHLEVHTNIIGKESDNRTRMNSLFWHVHEHGQLIQIDGIDIKVLEPTESLLFLILHAYKHFQNRGVGIRQMIDILLYYREYKHVIQIEELQAALKICEAESIWQDIRYIGYQYLGLCDEKPEQVCCPEVLLQDMMQAGVFGGQEKSDYMAANVNLSLENTAYKQGKAYTLIRSAFPSRQILLGGYPYLEEKPWLLPVVWGKRWFKFIRYAGKDVWKLIREILQKSSARMEIIKKYKK